MIEKEMFRQSLDYIQYKVKDILDEVTKRNISNIIGAFFKAKRIFVYGAGRSGLVSRAFAIRLVHLGFQTFVIGETIGAPVKKDDLVFVISGSGVTIPTVMTAEIARDIGATLIVVTGERNSRITKFADIAIFLSANCKDKERKQLAPLGTLFEASAWILLDSIIAEIMKKKGETEETMRSRHATLE
jgi:6-phospho-3-hexuloisomerase